MNQKPLQYSSLKSVILFLEPNLRLHLSCRLPSIRTAEKGTPLQIDNLRFEDNTIVVNDTEYQLSVYRKYHVEKPPIEVSGTVFHDLDEYGFEKAASNDLLPGDVRISNSAYDSVLEDDRFFIKMHLVDYERKLKNLRGSTVDLLYYKKRVNDYRQRLLPFEYRQNQQKSPCDLYYQLTIRNKSGIQSTYRIPHYEKLHIGMKQLMELLFGKRQEVWKVNQMHLDVPILRWPVSGVLPFVRKLRIGDLESINIETLKSIIHPSSFPLNTLEISLSNIDQRQFDNKMITAAKLLTLEGFPSKDQLVRIQNSQVFIKYDISPRDLCDLVSHWLRHGRPIGTCFTFDFLHVDPYECLIRISTLPDVMERSERLVKLSMKNSSVLLVSKSDRVVVVNRDYWQNWFVEMKVVHQSVA